MPTKMFFLLGGYGNTGRLLSRLLLQETDLRLLLARRSAAKVRAVAFQLNRQSYRHWSFCYFYPGYLSHPPAF